ncbi:MAG: hypothetical protein JWP25_6012 [Bradyrhizobium sp.]|nr:hypothetical protein [Bradyrhizobium sp.]
MIPIRLAASFALKKDFNGVLAVVSYLNNKKGHDHETRHNRNSSSIFSLERGRPGAANGTLLARNDHRSVSGVVHLAVGRHDKCGPHVEEHWPRRLQRKR